MGLRMRVGVGMAIHIAVPVPVLFRRLREGGDREGVRGHLARGSLEGLCDVSSREHKALVYRYLAVINVERNSPTWKSAPRYRWDS